MLHYFTFLYEKLHNLYKIQIFALCSINPPRIWIKYRFLLFVQESSTHLDKYNFVYCISSKIL